MAYNHKIYIIGFMGSGKSTVGKKLASVLGWSYTDLDRKIEEQSGSTIPKLFSQYGEDYFRIVESQVLKSLKAQRDIVVSTGGGTPCFSDNMDYMLETGLTLYLKLTPGQLKSRLSESKGERPLIKGLNETELLEFIEEKLALREQWYKRAEIVIEGINIDISLLKYIIMENLNK